MEKIFKRYCKTLQLEDDPRLMRVYRELHAMGAGWPEISAGMKEVGIIDMEIYIHGATLFMIMDTVADFDHDTAMEKLAGLPRQAEWEACVAKYQKTDPASSAKEKWTLMERIYKLDQKTEHKAPEGQVEVI